MKEMGSRTVGVAWKVILIADLGVLVYGLMATLVPEVLGEGFESYTGQSLSALLSASPKTGEYILLLGRLVGAFNVAFAVAAIAIVLMSFRRGEVWSWYALLIGNTVGYISPIVFDQTVGAINIFEQLEIVFIVLIYIMLGISAKDILIKKPV
jgi:hypothetical protein